MYNIIVINPGSTSTKIACFRDNSLHFSESIHHSVIELSDFSSIIRQLKFRFELIDIKLREKNVKYDKVDAWVGRGGLLKPIPGGTYLVDDEMIKDLEKGVQGEHASNLGGLLAHEFAKQYKKPAFIVDPVVVDELEDISRISGHKQFRRKSIFHALNHKAVGRQAAEQLGKSYSETNLIVAHLGGGISVAAHKQGRVVDVNNALDGEGPFSPERSGTLPAGDLVRLCYSAEFEPHDVLKMLTGKGGLVSYFGSNDIQQILGFKQEPWMPNISLVMKAMAFQIAKEIASMAAVFNGKVDAVVLTGGIVHNKEIVGWIEERISFIAPVFKYPGEEELTALAMGAWRVLTGQEEYKNYANEANLYDNNF